MSSETRRADEVKNLFDGVQKKRKQQLDESKAKNKCFFCREYPLILHCVEIKRNMFKSEGYDELFTDGPYSMCKARKCLRKWLILKGTYDFEQGSLDRTVPSHTWLAKTLTQNGFSILGRLH